MKRFKRSDTNDILITDYTSGKEVESQFPKSDMQAGSVTIATILNEKAKMASNGLMPIESSTKNPTMTLRTAKLSNNTGNIQITVFASLVKEITEDIGFSFTNMRVSRFQSDRLIKSKSKFQKIVTGLLNTSFLLTQFSFVFNTRSKTLLFSL